MQLQHQKIRQQYFPFLLRTSRITLVNCETNIETDCFKGDLIIWNNKDVTIEGKSLYWKTWSKAWGMFYTVKIFVSRILTNIYLMKTSRPNTTLKSISFYYFQILSSILKILKFKAMTIKNPPRTIMNHRRIWCTPAYRRNNHPFV